MRISTLRVSLETVIRGCYDKNNLLDIIENFTLFSEEGSGLVKLVGKNHQYLGVNNAFDALKTIRKREEARGVRRDGLEARSLVGDESPFLVGVAGGL